MLKQRLHYWTCSKFAEWILGEEKPIALEWGAWDNYYNDLKKRKPIRYWISQKMLKTLQNIAYFPCDIYRTINYYIRNRWIDKSHIIDTGFKPGGYYEIDEKILHGLFTELVDFVEKELAHMGNYGSKKKYKFKKGRCVEAAYEYFKWAGKLKDIYPDGSKQPSEQAKSARKIKKLYEWWTKTRPSRVDPYIASGWNEACGVDCETLYDKNKSSAQLKKQKIALKKLGDLEEKHDNEDTNMLIELIKIRHSLWT